MRQYQDTINHRLIMPLQHFINQEKSGGIVLGISIVIALILANSPWSDSYFHLLSISLVLYSMTTTISITIFITGSMTD